VTGWTNEASLERRARRAFPESLAASVAAAVSQIPIANFEHRDAEPAVVAGEQVWLPGRLYNPPIALAGTDTVSAVVQCLYTRHHDGYVRQRAVEALLAQPARPWAVPYVVRLAGEYVIEIVDSIRSRLDLSDVATRDMYGRFVAANPGFMTLARQRATSYWAEYYRRRYPVLRPKAEDRWDTYPGFLLLDELETAARVALD
jgi:hypothetical protein